MKKLYSILALVCFVTTSFSQSHITGTVTLDIEKGYMHCDFIVSNLPELSNYKILLNHGMNIKYFKNAEDELISYEGYYGGKVNGEGLEYYFVDERNVQIDLNTSFKIEYSGAFPVYKNSFNTFDFKGYIAINDNILRATEQSKWYPVVYDQQHDKLLTDYTYEITVITTQSKTVFINGTPPKKGKETVFSSTKAVPLFLFAGDYDFTAINGDYLINADVNKATAEKIFGNIDSIKAYYENLLGIDFADKIYLINHKAVKDLKDSNWGFNTYPAFGFANLNFNDLLTADNRFNENNYKFFAHELAHNYFGNNVNSGVLSWFWLEGAAEYLSLVALEDYTNTENVNEYYAYYIQAIEKKSFIPLGSITESNQINSDYRYTLAPLLFKAFEISFGKDKTIKSLKSVLELSKSQTLTLDSWQQAAIKSGVSKKEFADFKKKFLSSKRFKHNTVDLIRKAAASKASEK